MIQLQGPTREGNLVIYLSNVSRQHLQHFHLRPDEKNEDKALLSSASCIVIYFLTSPSLLNRDMKMLIEVRKAADQLWLGHVVFHFHDKFLQDVMGNKASVQRPQMGGGSAISWHTKDLHLVSLWWTASSEQMSTLDSHQEFLFIIPYELRGAHRA